MSSKSQATQSRKLLGLRSLFAAAVLAGVSSAASAALITVTGLDTTVTNGTASSTVAPGGANSEFFNANTNYTINYGGKVDNVTGVIAGTQSYNIIQPADTVTIRSNQTNTKVTNRQNLFYQGSVTGSTINLKTQRYNSLSDALKSNNVYVGVDNLFSNSHGGNGDNVRTERLDVVFNGGISASASKVFGVFDRGNATGPNSHDPFKIAAITSVDANGNPTGYGDVISVARGWGQASVLGSRVSTVVLRNGANNSSLTSPSAIIPQPVGGVLIPLDDLAGNGVTVYGYSLFAYDVTGTGDALLDVNDRSVYPTGTNNLADGGGLDLLGITGLMQLNSVPEPASLSLLALTAGGALMRRKRRA